MIDSNVDGRMEGVGFGWIDHWYYDLYGADGVWEYANGNSRFHVVNARYARRPKLVKSWREIRLC